MNKYGNKTILGIIAEYNPFHKGHEYQIKQALKKCGADYVIAVISGHFVQRGEPAIFDTYTRASMALSCNIDAAFDVPSPFSTASAEDFAGYGVSLLDKLGADYISFGCEDADLRDLYLIASTLLDENKTCADNPYSFKNIIHSELSAGKSYPSARSSAVLKSLEASGFNREYIDKIAEILKKPNNILGIEYIKSILRLNSKLKPVIIKRCGAEHNSTEISAGNLASAASIRKVLLNNLKNPESLAAYLPKPGYRIIKSSKPLSPDIITGYIYKKILEIKYTAKNSLDSYSDISADFKARLYNTISPSTSYEEMISQIKSKQYTYTRISRALIHIALNIKKEDMQLFKSGDYAYYARLIGFKKSGSKLLGLLKERAKIPIISKLADADKVLLAAFNEASPLSCEAGRKLLLKEIYAGELYNSLYYDMYKVTLPNVFERRFLTVD